MLRALTNMISSLAMWLLIVTTLFFAVILVSICMILSDL